MIPMTRSPLRVRVLVAVLLMIMMIMIMTVILMTVVIVIRETTSYTFSNEITPSSVYAQKVHPNYIRDRP